MSWTDYKVPTTMVETGDGEERPVRGLSLDDMSHLIVSNLDTMMDITALYIAQQKDIYATGNMVELITVASRQFPGFVSEVISIVTDTPDLKTMRLPAGLQLRILTAAIRLTVEDAGGLGNLSAMLQNVVSQVAAGQGEASRKLAAILSPSSTTAVGRTPTS